MQTITMGNLRCRITGGTDGAGGGTGPVVILMHGFGAPGTDLIPLGGALNVAADTRFVFPEAPLALGGPFGSGRAWWELDLDQLARRSQGEYIDRSQDAPAALPEVRKRILTLLDEAQDALHTSPERMVLGGFSQGAMLACDAALHSDLPLGGLILLSGTLINRAEWEPRMAALGTLPIFQSHGREDAVLPFEGAAALHDSLTAAGCDVTFESFSGGHEIPGQVLSAVTQFLTRA